MLVISGCLATYITWLRDFFFIEMLPFFPAILQKSSFFFIYLFPTRHFQHHCGIAQGNYYYNVVSNSISLHARNNLSNKRTSTYWFASWWIVTFQCKGQWSKLLMLRLCWTLPMLWSLLPRWKHRDVLTPLEFVIALISKFVARASPFVDSNELFSWMCLCCTILAQFMIVVGC